MTEKIIGYLTGMIRHSVFGKETDITEYRDMTEADWQALYALSKKHDLAHIVGQNIGEYGLLPEGDLRTSFEKQLFSAVYRSEKLDYELSLIEAALCEAKVEYLPLKGSVIKQLYPQPWLRTRGDIDILVHQDNLEKAREVLEKAPGFVFDSGCSHDISGNSPRKVHLELHYRLYEINLTVQANNLLHDAWKHAAADSNGYRYSFSNEYLYFYHFAHMAKHFMNDGCGIRPIIDTAVMNRTLELNMHEINRMLADSELLKFAQTAEKLSEIWFGEQTHDSLTKQLEAYIVTGGTYGEITNKLAVDEAKNGGKIKYLLSRIWLPYNDLICKYPQLKGKRILQPLYEIKRWTGLFDKTKLNRSIRHLNNGLAIPDERSNEMKRILDELGLL